MPSDQLIQPEASATSSFNVADLASIPSRMDKMEMLLEKMCRDNGKEPAHSPERHRYSGDGHQRDYRQEHYSHQPNFGSFSHPPDRFPSPNRRIPSPSPYDPYTFQQPFSAQEINNMTYQAPLNAGPSHRGPRIDIPIFTGAGVEGWLFQMERFFEVNSTPSDQKLSLATFYLAGEALRWFQWMYITKQLSSWGRFTGDLLQRFGPAPFWNAEVALNKLQQTSSVATYIQEFEDLSTRTPGLSADNLLNRFLAGLKEDIHTEIILFKPQTLQTAMGIARVAEQKLAAARSGTYRNNYQRPPWPTVRQPSIPEHKPAPAPIGSDKQPNPIPSKLPIRKLTNTEMTARRERGLCYNCDEKWNRGHQCKARFQCILIEDEDEPTEATEMVSETEYLQVEEDKASLLKLDLEPVSISFQALRGGFIASTLRLAGSISGKPVTILVDSGSTHNFIQTKVAKLLHLPTTASSYSNVTIGDGTALQCAGKCPKVQLIIGTEEFEIDFYILPIYGAEIVLGAQWLAELGATTFNYRELWMSFDRPHGRVTLEGMAVRKQTSEINLRQMTKVLSQDQAECFQSSLKQHITRIHSLSP